jgi:transcriptional regulator with XRE-family HTH domain
MAVRTEDPEVQWRRLRTELRRLREAAGMRQQDVAEAMLWSPSKLIRIEKGSVRVHPNDVRLLLAHYAVAEAERDELVLLAMGARHDRWADLRPFHSDSWLSYLGFEASASTIRNYETVYVPGLLQTEAYAMSVFRVDEVANDIAEKRWEGRQRRQELHDREDPPAMNFVVDEAAIRRMVGGPHAMRRQWRQLRELSDQPHVTLQVLPFDAGMYRSMGRSFILLELPDPTDPDIVYLEDETGGTVTRDSADATAFYADVFLAQVKAAMSPEATRELLDRLIASAEAEGAA